MENHKATDRTPDIWYGSYENADGEIVKLPLKISRYYFMLESALSLHFPCTTFDVEHSNYTPEDNSGHSLILYYSCGFSEEDVKRVTSRYEGAEFRHANGNSRLVSRESIVTMGEKITLIVQYPIDLILVNRV